jgi:hypothetical protein
MLFAVAFRNLSIWLLVALENPFSETTGGFLTLSNKQNLTLKTPVALIKLGILVSVFIVGQRKSLINLKAN